MSSLSVSLSISLTEKQLLVHSESKTAALKKVFALIALSALELTASSQVSSYNFRHITTSEGLSDGVVHDRRGSSGGR